MGRNACLVVVLLALPVIGCASRGQVYTPGNDVSLPVRVADARPSYTYAAMAAKIQGHVLLTCVVREDGTVDDVQVTRSLDSVHGLDEEAIQTVRQWQFKPGMRNGRPVAVRVAADVEFALQ